MLRRSLATIALLFAAALPLAHGQSLPYLERDLERAYGPANNALDWPAAHEGQILPVVSRSDGRLEALLLLDAPPTLNPLDQLLYSPRPRLGAAARVRLDDANSVEAALKLDRGPALALLCDQSIGLATTLASLNQHCLLAPLAAGSGAGGQGLLGTASSREIEAAWHNERLGIDLSFGLSWLDSGRLQPAPGDATALPTLAALLMPNQLFSASLLPGQFGFSMPELAGARLISRGIGVRGMFDLGSQRWLSFGGSHSNNRLEPGMTGGFGERQWDSNALSLGLGQGNLYGELTGHVSDLPGSDAFWGGVDVGISWRTPWDARLTVGARNLISRGTNPWLDGGAAAAEEPDTRVPYVRYRQDL